MSTNQFFKQVDLLLRVLPYVLQDERLALKGGTAINLFVRDMPRLSVDIDLTYLVIEDRETSLNNLSQILLEASNKISSAYKNVRIQPVVHNLRTRKLIIRSDAAVVKVEPSEVIRGAVFPCQNRDLCQKASEQFQMFTSVRTLDNADLYGGKICAALDRQHPRDLFDIKILFEQEGLTDNIRKAFLVYLISHDRPMHEILNPNLLDKESVFENEFKGLTSVPLTYQELCDVRNTLIQRIQNELTTVERRFLLSVKEKNPSWSLIGIPGIEKLPAVQWKIKNLERMSLPKHTLAVEKLKRALNL